MCLPSIRTGPSFGPSNRSDGFSPGSASRTSTSFRAEDRTNFAVFNKYTGGNHFEPTWLDGDNDNDDDNEAAAHSSDNIMDTST